MDPIEPEAGFVHQIWPEGVDLVQGEYLAVGLANIAKPGYRVAPQNRLPSEIPLKGIVPVQAVIVADEMAHISSPLIDVDGRSGRPQKPRAVDKSVGVRYECEQLGYRWISYRRAVRIAESVLRWAERRIATP